MGYKHVSSISAQQYGTQSSIPSDYSLTVLVAVPKYLDNQRHGKWEGVKEPTDDAVGQRV